MFRRDCRFSRSRRLWRYSDHGPNWKPLEKPRTNRADTEDLCDFVFALQAASFLCQSRLETNFVWYLQKGKATVLPWNSPNRVRCPSPSGAALQCVFGVTLQHGFPLKCVSSARSRPSKNSYSSKRNPPLPRKIQKSRLRDPSDSLK
jgi:hypothetical protein